LAKRLLERTNDDIRARPLVALQGVECLLDRIAGVDERNAAARDDALLERRTGRSSLDRVTAR